jgi:hypothetical protein
MSCHPGLRLEQTKGIGAIKKYENRVKRTYILMEKIKRA